MWPFLLALQVSFSAPLAPSSPSAAAGPVDSLAAHALERRIDRTADAFFRSFRSAWMSRQDELRPREWSYRSETLDGRMRTASLHCHTVPSRWGPPLSIQRNVIRNSMLAQPQCPWWYPQDAPKIWDERFSIDAGFRTGDRVRLRAERAVLQALLDTAAQQDPQNARWARQRVRFALDAGDVPRAANAALECAAGVAECTLLQGLVMHQAGVHAAADSTFAVAMRAMPAAERCAWADVAVLLEPEARERYSATPCAERSAFEERLWWLADPLYREPGNERRAEHFARKVMARLRQDWRHDERLHWHEEHGGGAVAEMVVRYGWPTQFYWGGFAADTGHASYLLAIVADTSAPYVVAEYTAGRLHTLPAARALDAPLRATPRDWQLRAPTSDLFWWPREHWAREAGPIATLPAGQHVLFRRSDAARVAWGTALDAKALARPRGQAVQADFFHSTGPTNVVRMGTFAGVVGRGLRFHAPLPSDSGLVALEIGHDSLGPAARTRFGLHAPATLRELGVEPALSPPLLFDPSGSPPNLLDLDGAVARMLLSTELERPRRVGVYWESYGFIATDTLDLEVRLTRQDEAGITTRIVDFFRPGPGPDPGTVSLRWRELPGVHRARYDSDEGVAVAMRNITLELSALPRSTYTLAVAVRNTQGRTATNEMTLVIR